MDVQQKIAWNLRRLRVAKGLSQESLAVDAGVDRTYVSRLERSMENPTAAVLDRIAKALGVAIEALFATPEPDEEPPVILPKGRRPQR